MVAACLILHVQASFDESGSCMMMVQQTIDSMMALPHSMTSTRGKYMAIGQRSHYHDEDKVDKEREQQLNCDDKSVGK